MDFFNPARNDNERYNNALLSEIKRTNELLERIYTHLNQGGNQNEFHPTEGIPVHSPSEGQQGQRSSNGTRGRRKR